MADSHGDGVKVDLDAFLILHFGSIRDCLASDPERIIANESKLSVLDARESNLPPRPAPDWNGM